VRAVCVLLVGSALLVPSAEATRNASPPLGTLLARHSPVLVFHPAERFRPVPVEGFLAVAELQQPVTAGGWEPVEGPPPAGGSALRLDHVQCSVRDGVAAVDCYAAAQAASPSEPTVYGAAFRTRTRLVLQYWLWYPLNLYSPTVPAGEIWQAHEGDWESVSVILDLGGRPLLVGLSQHCEGVRREWKRAPKRGSRPLVYVALGSHANLFEAGTRRLDPRCFTREVITIIEALGEQPVDHAARGPVVRPRLVRVSSTSPEWMRFAGTWGEDAYIHFPANEPIVYGAGPRGPAFHEQWRRPVADVATWPRG
jgi:hypothetical protein